MATLGREDFFGLLRVDSSDGDDVAENDGSACLFLVGDGDLRGETLGRGDTTRGSLVDVALLVEMVGMDC